jgi:hypothetical protein
LTVLVLAFGVGAIFFFIGLMLSLSKSVKGSAIVTFLLGLLGGGTGGLVFGGGHVALTGESGVSVGWLLLAIGVGGSIGVILGTCWKVWAQRREVNIGVSIVQPNLDPNDQILPGSGG